MNMSITQIKENIENHCGEDVRIVYHGSRNKREVYNGTISETYQSIFIVKLDSSQLKSFCYSDVLINSIQLYF